MAIEEQWTATQWLKHAAEELQKRGTPSPELIHSLAPGDWAGEGYLVFSNGWASFTSHSSHDSEKIGNIGLPRTSDGDFYVNNFHFCMGQTEFQGPNKIQPKDFSHFSELYGVRQKWKKKP